MIIRLTILIIAICCLTCEVPEVVLDPVPIYGPSDTMYWPKYGEVNALKNGWKWTANARGGKFYSDTFMEKRMCVTFESYIEGIDKREIIIFCYMNFSPGIYEVVGEEALHGQPPSTNEITTFYRTLKSDGDVIEDRYIADTRRTANFFAITYVDTIENIVRGSFDMTFRLIQPQDNPFNPKTVTFSAGNFDAKFRN